MRITRDQFDGKVIDDRSGDEVAHFLWLDTESLELCVGWAIYSVTTQVSSVRVNWAAKVIHVNDPPAQAVSTPTAKPASACANCRQEETCRRIDYCAAHKCCF